MQRQRKLWRHAAVGLAGVVAMLMPVAVDAQEAVVRPVTRAKASYADVRQALEDAIIAGGYKIDYVGKVGDMLSRTAKDIGATKAIYAQAEYLTFCSAVLSRQAMEADPVNISVCPYIVFVYEPADSPGKVFVGYRRPSGSQSAASKTAVDAIDKLLTNIVKGASE
jgi:uncharacterized protein (DUF302 family)